jgi:hypothetical protein
VVDPLVPDVVDAVQVLDTELAVNGPAPTFFTDAELVTDRFPFVVARMAPEGGMGPLAFAGGRPPKTTAGPYAARAPLLSVAVTAVEEPPGGRVTDGLAVPPSPGGVVCPAPSRADGPPNRLTSV